MRKRLWALAGALALVSSISANAGDFKTRQGSWAVGGNLGYAQEPGLFAMQALVDYYVTDEVGIGPLAQFGINGRDNFFGISGQVRYSALLARNNVVRPYGTLGIGYAEFRVDDLFKGEQKAAFLLPVGGGFEFKLTDDLALDANVLFNISERVLIGLFAGVDYIF